MRNEVAASKDKLMADFRAVILDAEELLHATANQAGEKVSAARGRVQESLRTAKQELQDAEAAQQAAVDRGQVHAGPRAPVLDLRPLAGCHGAMSAAAAANAERAPVDGMSGP